MWKNGWWLVGSMAGRCGVARERGTLQRGSQSLPEGLNDFFQRLDNLIKFCTGQGVEGVFAVAFGSNDVLSFKDAKMMGGNGLFDIQVLVDVRYSHLPVVVKQVNDCNAYGVGNRTQCLSRVFQKIDVEMSFHGYVL